MSVLPLVIGNWKMLLSYKAELEVARSLKKILSKQPLPGVDVVVCPSYVALPAIAEEFAGVNTVEVGAQHVHWEEKGPWTGLVSINQILPFAQWCIVGHSEQRALTGMTDEQVSMTAVRLVRYNISPVVCIGETFEERAGDRTTERITEQVQYLLSAVTRSALAHLVIAYEPIWAISSNNPTEPPRPDDVVEVALLIRKLITARFGEDAAARVRMVYGGSVSEDTVFSFVDEPGIDGVLVGSASVHPLVFAKIATVVQQANT